MSDNTVIILLAITGISAGFYYTAKCSQKINTVVKQETTKAAPSVVKPTVTPAPMPITISRISHVKTN